MVQYNIAGHWLIPFMHASEYSVIRCVRHDRARRAMRETKMLALTLLAMAVPPAAAATAARPHILMMLADDWGSYDVAPVS